MNTYEEKQEARRERFEARAEKASEASSAALDKGMMGESVTGIPLGQPILVGHHSEGRHRAIIKRSDRAMRRACEEQKKAKHYAHKAEAVGRGGISSDDPDAVRKLREKMERLEADRAQKKAVNAAWRKAGRPEPDNKEGWAVLAERFEGVDKIRVDMAFGRTYGQGRSPFPAYNITSDGAEIRRLKKRIEELSVEKVAADPVVGEGWRIVEDVEDNRLLFIFDAKPAREVCQIMRRFGFRWSPTRGAWCRQLNSRARFAAECVVENIGRLGET